MTNWRKLIIPGIGNMALRHLQQQRKILWFCGNTGRNSANLNLTFNLTCNCFQESILLGFMMNLSLMVLCQETDGNDILTHLWTASGVMFLVPMMSNWLRFLEWVIRRWRSWSVKVRRADKYNLLSPLHSLTSSAKLSVIPPERLK